MLIKIKDFVIDPLDHSRPKELQANLIRYLSLFTVKKNETFQDFFEALNKRENVLKKLNKLPTKAIKAIHATIASLNDTDIELMDDEAICNAIEELFDGQLRKLRSTIILKHPEEAEPTFTSSYGLINMRTRSLLPSEKIWVCFSSLQLSTLPVAGKNPTDSYIKAVNNNLKKKGVSQVTILTDKNLLNESKLRKRANYGLFSVFTSLNSEKSPIKSSRLKKKREPKGTIGICRDQAKHVKLVIVNKKSLNSSSVSSTGTPKAKLKPTKSIRRMPKTPAASESLRRAAAKTNLNAVLSTYESLEGADELMVLKSDCQLEIAEDDRAVAVENKSAIGAVHSDRMTVENPCEWLHLIANSILAKGGRGIDKLVSQKTGNDLKSNLIIGRSSVNTQMLFVENEVRKCLKEGFDVKLEVTTRQEKHPKLPGTYSHFAESVSYEVSIGYDFHLDDVRANAPVLRFNFSPLDVSQLRPIREVLYIIESLFYVFKKAVSNQSSLISTPTASENEDSPPPNPFSKT